MLFRSTLGHALETYFLNTETRLLHGEAIAIGMIAESFLSYKHNKISENELKKIQNYIISIFGKFLLNDTQIDEIIPLTIQDKKNSHGKVKFSLLNGIGNCDYDIEINLQYMKEALKYYAEL